MLAGDLFAGAFLLALLGSILSIALRDRIVWSIRASGISLAIASLLGAGCGLSALIDDDFSISISRTVLGNGSEFSISFTVGELQGLFIFIVSIVALAVSVYSVGHNSAFRRRYGPAIMGSMLCLFYPIMLMAISADNVLFFLISWEIMSVVSYLLVVYEGREEGSGQAGLYYLVMTHIGTGMIAISLLMMASEAGSYRFEDLAGVGDIMSPASRDAAFLLLLFGFGAKAGIVPMHVWMPYTYGAAPGSVAALMSGATIKIALMYLVVGFYTFLGAQETWWGIAVLLVACVTCVIGVLYANIERDLKRLLSFSSVENVGIMLMALGAGMVFHTYTGLEALSALALIALLLHALNHSVFKSLLFLGAGAVERATGETDLERMGGLAKRMPYTSALFLIGALSISAIPPFSGFVSEWLIFQTLLQSFQIADVSLKILFPIAIGILALTGALATAAFVRVYGLAFLAMPRSERASSASEVPRAMLYGMAFLAVICTLSGVLSFAIIPAMDEASESVLGVSASELIVDGWTIVPANEGFSSMSPAVISLMLLLTIPVVAVLAYYYGGKAKIDRKETWDCGTPLTSRNEYSATAFSQPIVRVFSSVYRPQSEVSTEYTSSPYVKKKVSYILKAVPIFEKYIYRPIINAGIALAKRSSRIQAGSIQAYLAYIFLILVVLLVVFR